MWTSCALPPVFHLLLAVFASSVFAELNPRSSSLPVVDLGYELHQATLYNSSVAYYNFSNIRYAAPPTGRNRFALPQPPESDRNTVQTGAPDRICPQATSKWLSIADQFLSYYIAGQTQFNTSSFNETKTVPPKDPRETEDCLFLDVDVPKAVFDNAKKENGAAVLVWIYGGGYTGGSKTYWGNPAGFIDRSELDDQTGIIVSNLVLILFDTYLCF